MAQRHKDTDTAGKVTLTDSLNAGPPQSLTCRKRAFVKHNNVAEEVQYNEVCQYTDVSIHVNIHTYKSENHHTNHMAWLEQTEVGLDPGGPEAKAQPSALLSTGDGEPGPAGAWQSRAGTEQTGCGGGLGVSVKASGLPGGDPGQPGWKVGRGVI